MNKEHFIQAGWYMRWQGQMYQIVTIDSIEQVMHVELVHTRDALTIAMVNLFSETNTHNAEFSPSLEGLGSVKSVAARHIDVSGLPASLLEQAEHILKTVEEVEGRVLEVKQRAKQHGERHYRTATLREVLKQIECPVSLATFYKYSRLYKANDGVCAQLAGSLRRSTFQQSKFSAAELHFVDMLVMRYYARSRPLRPLTVYELGQSILKRTDGHWINPDKDMKESLIEELLDPRIPINSILENGEKISHLTKISFPSRAWFYTYLKWFVSQPDSGKEVISKRYGSQAWDQTYAVFDTFVNRATMPLQYVFADHALLDVYIVDEASRSQVSRLWLTVLIDAYSRSILGIALLDEHPSIMSIQSALEHAIWPKTSHHVLGLDEVWVCYGIPQQLSLDNAWAHHSHSLENLSREISRNGRYASIDLVFRPPYRARYGALVERFFGNLSVKIKSQLPGAIQSGEAIDLRQAAEKACLLYQDMRRIVHQLILNYQHHAHSELEGMSPHEKWLSGLGMSSPLVPAKTLETERLFWRLHPNTRVMTSKGISAFGMHYWSSQWGGAQRIGRDGQKIRYHFRYDPNDISRIALFNDGQWVGDGYAKELRQANGQTKSLSASERHLAQQRARQYGQGATNWLSFISEIDQLTHRRNQEKRKIRRSQGSRSTIVKNNNPTPKTDYTELLVGFTRDMMTKEDTP